ncbi:LysR family transcriptional regulator [Phyllobacterium sp. K27]
MTLGFEELRTFIEVADAGGLSVAARRLGVSKSLVSRRISKLEAELRVQLLARTPRGIALTEPGIAFKEHAARIISEMDAALEIVSPTGDLRGRLRISAPISFGVTHLTPVLSRLALQHPHLEIAVSFSDYTVDLVAEGFDCAVRIGVLPDSNLIGRRIGPVRGTLVASPDYIAKHGAPKCLEDIAKHEAVMQKAESWRFLGDDGNIAIRPQGRFKVDNGIAVAKAAAAGLGLAVLPNFVIEEQLESGALVEVLPHHPLAEVDMYVVRPPGLNPARKIRVFIELMIEQFSKAACTNGSTLSAPRVLA